MKLIALESDLNFSQCDLPCETLYGSIANDCSINIIVDFHSLTILDKFLVLQEEPSCQGTDGEAQGSP